MTIELPREVEMHLRDSLRRRQLAEFQSAIAERMASLDAGETVDGEAVMARLIAELPSR
jgi:predicted transcriptional regulator